MTFKSAPILEESIRRIDPVQNSLNKKFADDLEILKDEYEMVQRIKNQAASFKKK
jgi:hypothetical protein